MEIISKVKFQFNVKIRHHLNSDLKLLYKQFQNKYPYPELSNTEHMILGLNWLSHTNSLLKGKGFPTKFNVQYCYGLGPAYPETTGYTLCTLLAILRNQPLENYDYNHICTMVESSANFLLNECQLENGSFTGGHAKLPNFGKPSSFNTGQILLGLVDLYETLSSADFKFKKNFKIEISKLETSIKAAANFLAGEINEDGAFNIRYSFWKASKTYYSSSTYGLLRAGIVLKQEYFITSAKRNFDWILTMREQTGWINEWGFESDWAVLHAIAYTLRGLIEAYLHFNHKPYLDAVISAINFIQNFDKSKFSHPSLIPSYTSKSGGFLNELCLTGLSQLSIVIAKIPQEFRLETHQALAKEIDSKTKCFQCRGFQNPSMNGIMPASYPLSGRYQSYDLIEWGLKYFMDTLLLNMGLPVEQIRG